ncbi:MAG: radical SAM protein [Firmicutes bacterium]|nr:radical SAM protein [Bacillota bacterium]
MNERTFRIGPIRPPSEAQSLLLQVTNGCTWNKCRFCQLYRHTKFKAYSADSIKADIDNMVYHAERARKYLRPDGAWDINGLNRELMIGTDEERQCFYMVANWLVNGGENVFLQDGNTTALSSGRLTDVLIYLRQAFPQIKRITSYGRAENLSRVSADEFAELKEAGLDRIHSGFESGSDAVLQRINKGVTSQQEITAGRNIKAGGIELSVYFMPGVGGRDLSRDNAEGMANVINEVNPDFIRIRTSVIKPGTELYEDFISGAFELCSDDEKLMEIRTVIEKAHDIDTKLVSDHIVNLLQGVKGSLRNDRQKMLDYIDGYMAQPEEDRKIYQALRRMGRIVSPGEVSRTSSSELDNVRRMISETDDPYEWEIRMNELMCRYI